MSYELYFKPLETQRLKSVDELVEKTSELIQNCNYQEISSAELSLTPEGKIKTPDGEFSISRDGFIHYLRKILKIPNPFAKRIPWDLLQENFNRLTQVNDEPVTMVIKDNYLLNITRSPLTMIELDTVLENFRDQKTSHIEFSLANSRVQWFVENELVAEPKPGDLTRVGVDFISSITGFGDILAKGLMYTLICSNGAVIPSKELGKVRIRLSRSNLNVESITSQLNYKIQDLLDNSGKVLIKLTKANEIRMNFKKLYSVLKTTTKITEDRETVLDKFEMNYEDWSEIKAKAKSNDEMYNETDFTIYDSYSRITNLANDYLGSTRSKLQILAGKHLEWDELRLN